MNLIFNADDFGSHPSISRGIIQAIEHGVVRSTTVMACNLLQNVVREKCHRTPYMGKTPV